MMHCHRDLKEARVKLESRELQDFRLVWNVACSCIVLECGIQLCSMEVIII